MSEGGTYASLRQRYTSALSAGENSLRALLGSSSASWKSVQTVTPNSTITTEDAAALSKTEEAPESVSGISGSIQGRIVVDRKRMKGAPHVARAVCTIPICNASNTLESFRAVLDTHPTRSKWDPITEKQEVLEVIEPSIKLIQTYTKVGWPSSARDLVTIDKTLYDPGKTLIYLSVSLPRSTGQGNDDPPFLQPSPPYVRSHMHLCAFVVTCPTPKQARLSMYCQWDLKGSSVVWTNHVAAMPKILTNLVAYSRQQSLHMPYIRSWGKGLSVELDNFDALQDKLEIQYGIFVDEAPEDHDKNHVLLEKSKERRRLERSMEVRVPVPEHSGAGWDLTLSSLDADARAETAWQVSAEREEVGASKFSRVTIRITHPRPRSDYGAFKLILQRLAGGKSLRVNGDPLTVVSVEERNPLAYAAHTVGTLQSAAPLKAKAHVLAVSASQDAASHTTVTTRTSQASARINQTAAAERDLLAHIQRSYAQFLSLLQAPRAKWRSVNEVRHISVSTYMSIDPHSVPVYRYEATFTNTTIWDLLSVITNNGSRLVWDRSSGLDRFQHLGDLPLDTPDAPGSADDQAAGDGRVSFWEARWRAVWPTASREAVFLRTAYRSRDTIHILQTSVPEDEHNIWQFLADKVSPPSEGTMKLHNQLQAVSLDQISPTTTSLILFDQTSPKTWAKSGYAAMANAVANIGDFATTEGAPPLLTHMSGARVVESSYTHNGSGIFNLMYDTSESRKFSTCECVIRLDLDIWAPSGAHMKIDPPPTRLHAVARHRLSEKASGCWITIEHAIAHRDPDRDSAPICITVERDNDSSASEILERNLVTVNGQRIKVTVEDLSELQILERKLHKRVINRAVELDRTPTPRPSTHFARPPSIAEFRDIQPTSKTGPLEPLHGSVQKVTPMAPTLEATPSPPQRLPSSYAFEALATLQHLHKETSAAKSDASDWTILSYAENNSPIRISKRTIDSISPSLPLYRVERTFPNVSEEQVLRLLQTTSSNTRTVWDERLSSLENVTYGPSGLSTSIWIAKPSFPARSRIAYIASIRAQEEAGSTAPNKARHVTYLASASFPIEAFKPQGAEGGDAVAWDRLNPSNLYAGSVPLEGWVLETSSAMNDDEEDDTEPRVFTKCSFFTCSDLPLMTPGTFGQAGLRARLARMLDLLESSSKLVGFGILPKDPLPALLLGTGITEGKRKPRDWLIRRNNKCPGRTIATTPTSVTVSVRLPQAILYGASGISDKGSITNGSSASIRSQAISQVDSLDRTHNDGVDGDAHLTQDHLVVEFILPRDSRTSGYNLKAIATLSSTRSLPTDTSFWDRLTPLPLQAKVFPMTLPANLATRYVVRITLPTSDYTSPLEHPLSNLAPLPPLPRWYRKLSSGAGGIIQIQAYPVRAETIVDGRPRGQPRFTFDGQPVAMSVNPASAPSRQFSEDTARIVLDELVSSDTAEADRLGSPILVNTAFIKQLPSRHKSADIQSPLPGSPAKSKDLTSTLPEDNQATSGAGVVSSNAGRASNALIDFFIASAADQELTGEGTGGSKPVRRTYRLSFVVLVAVTFFLLGLLVQTTSFPKIPGFKVQPLHSHFIEICGRLHS